MYVCIRLLGFKGASTAKVIGARNEMMMDDYDGQMIFGDLVGLKLPDIRLIDEQNPPRKPLPGNWPDVYDRINLFNDDHVLHLRSELVVVHRRKMILYDYDVDDTRERMWPKLPEICVTVEEKFWTRKLTRPGIKPGWDASTLPLDHSSAHG